MVIKKKKITKRVIKKKTTKKKPLKKKPLKKKLKDALQDLSIKELKRKLTLLSNKFLNVQKKKHSAKTFDKIRRGVKKKIADTTSKQTLGSLTTALQKAPSSATPSLYGLSNSLKETIKDAQRTTAPKKTTIQQDIKGYREAEKSLTDSITAYNNGDLSLEQIADTFIKLKKYANIIGKYTPTREEISSTYRSTKNKLKYFKDLAGSLFGGSVNLPDINDDAPSSTPTRRPPTPPPAPTPTPTPTDDIDPEFPEEEMPDDIITPPPPPPPPPSILEKYSPYIAPSALGLTGLGLGYGISRGINRFLNPNRNQQVREFRNDLAENVLNNVGQVAVQGTLNEFVGQETRLERMTRLGNEAGGLNDSLRRHTNRPRLRQRDTEIRDNQQIANNQRIQDNLVYYRTRPVNTFEEVIDAVEVARDQANRNELFSDMSPRSAMRNTRDAPLLEGEEMGMEELPVGNVDDLVIEE
tara:strand:+ start:5417 stop:6820 length:1404 start_codon:yes stop_codon:yes gene_type:complete